MGGCYQTAEVLRRFRRSLAVNSIGVSFDVAAQLKRAEAAGKPEMGSLFEDVYMNKTAQLRAQEAELMSLEGPEAEDIGEFPL